MSKLSHNFFFALLIAFGIMALIMLFIVVGAGAWYVVREAFQIFPYHTVFAVVIFWIWFAKRIMPEIRDDDNDL